MGQLTFQFPLFIFFIFILNLQNIHCITVDEEECFMPLNVELQFPKELLEHINGKLTLTASQFRQNRMRSSLSSVWTFYAVLLFWVHFLFPEVHVQVSLGKYEKKVIKKKINSWSSKLKTENLARKKKKKRYWSYSVSVYLSWHDWWMFFFCSLAVSSSLIWV